jgi:hypothetical protein
MTFFRSISRRQSSAPSCGGTCRLIAIATALITVLTLFGASSAYACRSPESYRGVIFDIPLPKLPSGARIWHGTIHPERYTKVQVDGRSYIAVGLFKPDADDDGSSCRVVIVGGSCSFPFQYGRNGYVIGRVIGKQGGRQVLLAEEDAIGWRRLRAAKAP